MVRKSPVRHRVESYQKDSGKVVNPYMRGSGVRLMESRRKVVGQLSTIPGGLYEDVVDLEIGGHDEDFIKLFKVLGFELRSLTPDEFKKYYPDTDVEEAYSDYTEDEYDGIYLGSNYYNPVLLSKGGRPVKLVNFIHT